MICHLCNYAWVTKSKLRYVTCPDCHRKTKNKNHSSIKEGLKNFTGI